MDSSVSDLMIAPTQTLHGDNPFQLDPRSDLLATPDHDSSLWSETMFFVVWSPEQQVGLWLHMGVVPEDKTMWWAQTYAMLPDGVVLVDRSYGRTTDPAGPDTGNLKVRCVEPHRRWRLTFDGAGQVSSTDELGRELVGAGVATPFRFEIDLNALVPVYDMHAAMSGEIDWGMGEVHHEQGFQASGSLTALGKTWTIDGIGTRDHSRGPRDFNRYGGHVWTYSVWPKSRRAVGVFTMWRRDAPTVNATVAMITETGATEVFGDFNMTGTAEFGGHPHDVTLSLLRADGTRIDLAGQVQHSVTMTYADPNHNLNGAALDPAFQGGDPLIADESIVAWTWPDGEIGYGNLERGFRRSMLPCPQIPLRPGSPFAPQSQA